jgi:DNA-binding transcriptional ArsR family regulator
VGLLVVFLLQPVLDEGLAGSQVPLGTSPRIHSLGQIGLTMSADVKTKLTRYSISCRVGNRSERALFCLSAQDYYRPLNAVRLEGDWEGWIRFFFEGVASIAKEVTDAARDLYAPVSADRARVLAAPASSVMAVRLFEALGQHPIVTIARLTELLEITKPTATKAVNTLVDAGILTETSGRRRDRTYSYAAYLDRLRVGTELEG